jgi:hypothetical protein
MELLFKVKTTLWALSDLGNRDACPFEGIGFGGLFIFSTQVVKKMAPLGYWLRF